MQLADSGSFVYANPRTIHWGPGSLGRCLAQELCEVLGVGGALAGVVRRADAGCAGQRGGFDAGVIGDAHAARAGCGRARLAERVRGE